MAKKKISEYERFMALSDAQKDAEVAIFDRHSEGFPMDKTQPLTRADKALHRRAIARARAVAAGKAPPAKRIASAGPGRPRVGKGAKPIAITVERDLLAEVDRFVKKHNTNRSELIARGLQMILKAG